MIRLSDIKVRRFFNRSRLQRVVEELQAIPGDENFCLIKISAHARLPRKKLEGVCVSHIPIVCRHTAAAGLELAVAMISEQAAQAGWHFHLPSKGTTAELYHTNRSEVTEEAQHAVDELIQLADEDDIDDRWHHFMHDIGAAGRKKVYLRRATNPEGFAIGIRVQREPSQE